MSLKVSLFMANGFGKNFVELGDDFMQHICLIAGAAKGGHLGVVVGARRMSWRVLFLLQLTFLLIALVVN